LDDREADEEEEEEEERREWEKCEEVVTEKEEEEEETEERKNEYSPIDLTQIDDDDDNNIINNNNDNDNNDIDRYIDDTDEDEPQPLAWRLLKKAAEKRYDERGSGEREALREEEAYDDKEEEKEEKEEEGEDDVRPTPSHPLSSPPDYSSKTDQELAKELAKYGMKRLGSRTAMIDCLMNIWTEKMVERGDGAAYSQRLEEELLSLSQRDLNVSNNNPTSIAGLTTKKRKKNGTSILRGARTSREEEDEEVGDDDDEEEEEEEEENEAVGIDERALHAKLTAFLKSSRDVYATILRMEPIDIDEVKKLCENGLRMKCISKVKLANYFESKGVAVRHNAPKKKKKTTTNKQTTPSGRIEKELPNHNGERRAAVEIFSPIREEDTY
jgi:hypothetical protein